MRIVLYVATFMQITSKLCVFGVEFFGLRQQQCTVLRALRSPCMNYSSLFSLLLSSPCFSVSRSSAVLAATAVPDLEEV